MSGALRFHRPGSVEEALDLLARLGDDGLVVAGSTAVPVLVRNGLVRPTDLVSITRIPGMRDIAVAPDDVALGALVTHRRVELDPAIREALPVLAATFARVANVRVRNAATVGGVVAEADYASDPPTTLVGLGATVRVRGADGEREVAAADFFRGFYESALNPGELVTGVRVPRPPAGTSATYVRYVTRSTEDRPLVAVFASCRRADDGTFADVRVAVGAACEVPARHADLERAASGTDLGDDVIRALADGYAARVDALDDLRGSAWYRTEMVGVWVRRALTAARDAAA